MRERDNDLYKDKIEVSLDSRQIFYLFFGGAVIASMVFVLGVMVGKKVEARSVAHAAAQSSVERDPLAALDKLDGAGDLAFADALRGKGSARSLGAVDALLAPMDAKPPVPGPLKADDDKAKKQELEAKKKADEAKKAQEAKKAEAAKKKAEEVEAKKKADEAKKAEAAKAKKKKFTLQVSSFQDRAEAEAMVSKLRGAGFSPRITKAEVPEKGTWFRVRVGKYSYDEAIEAKKSFEASQQLIAYVTRL